MRLKELTLVAIVAGAIATTGSAYFGWSVLCSVVADGSPSDNARRRVTLGPTRLRYFEDDNVLTLYAEMGSDREGAFYIVYVPGPGKWSRTMPDWCRNRRVEVMAEIKRLTQHERIRWVEDSGATVLPNKVLQADDHLGRFAPSVARR